MTYVSRSQMIAWSAAAIALAPRPARTQGLEHVRFSGVPTDDMTPIYWALKNGLYEKAGIDLEIMPATSGSTATTAVASGTYEMGKSSPLAAINAHLRSLPVVVIGNGPMWDAKNPYTQTLVGIDSNIKTGADFNGKTLATPGLNDTSQLGVIVWIDKNGGDSRTVHWVELSNSSAPAALAQGRVDGCTVQEPAATAAVEARQAKILAAPFSAIAPHFPIGVYMANANFAATHGDLVKRWVRVTYDAAKYTNTHKAETAPMMAEITKIPLAVFARMPRVEDATSTDPAVLQPLIDAAAKYNFIVRAIPAKDAYDAL